MNFLVAFPSVAVAVLVILGSIWRWSNTPADRRRTEYVLVATIFSLILNSIAEGVVNRISSLRPLKYDLYVFRIDALFGEPSFRLGRLAERYLFLHDLVSVSYEILPMVLVAVFTVYLYLRPTQEVKLLLWCFTANLFLAVPLYLLFPVCGPAFAFPTFPHLAAVPHPHPVTLSAPPNGVPSVHMSSALLVLWLLRRWRVGLVCGAAFVALTAFATLGSGQHYLFDLLCAVPFACGVYLLAARSFLIPGPLAKP